MSERTDFLAEYEKWARAGRPGLAPSPLPFGLMSCDLTMDLCAVDEKLRLESGLSSWQFYAPKAKKP